MRVETNFRLQSYVPILCTTLALLIVDIQLNVLADEPLVNGPSSGRGSSLRVTKLQHEQARHQQQQVARLKSIYGPRSSRPLAAVTPYGRSFNLFDLFSLFSSPKKTSRQNLTSTDPESIIETAAENKSEWEFANRLPLLDRLFGAAIDKVGTNSSNLVKDESARKSPVILVPGYGGSRLEAKLDKPQRVHYFCDLKSDWVDAWVNVKLLLPFMLDCLIDNLRLEYDYSTNTTKNTPGVEIRVKNDEQVSSVEYLNGIQINGFAYFAPIIEQLVSAYNYTRESDLLGAPYDFRKAPNELGEYFERLKLRTEALYRSNNQKLITFICHSMGCNNLLYFFQRQSKSWKQTYVKRLISIAAPWGGCLMALRAAAMGDDLGMPYMFSESQLIKVQRSLPSTIYLFPHKKAFDNVPLIRTNVDVSTYNTSLLQRSPAINIFSWNKAIKKRTGKEETTVSKDYYANDLNEFFQDINHPDGYQMWLDTKDLLGSLEAPEVELWCLVGCGQKTLGRMEYVGDFPESPSLDLYDDGDGTVSLQSAQYCKRWSSEQEEPVYYREFEAAHAEILKETQVLEYIEKILKDSDAIR